MSTNNSIVLRMDDDSESEALITSSTGSFRSEIASNFRQMRSNLVNFVHFNNWAGHPPNIGGSTSTNGFGNHREVMVDAANSNNLVVNVSNPISQNHSLISNPRLLASEEAPERIQQIHRLMMHHHGFAQPHTLQTTVSEPHNDGINRNSNVPEDSSGNNSNGLRNSIPDPVPNRVDVAAGTGRSGNGPADELQDAMAQIPEARNFIRACLRYLPFVFMVILKFSYDNYADILRFCIFFFGFTKANHKLKQEIAKKNNKNIRHLLFELLYVLLTQCLVLAMPQVVTIIKIVLLHPTSKIESMSQLLYCILICDFIVKLFTILVKIVITLMPPSIVECKGRGRIYLLVEAISQFYRSLTPIQPWVSYIYHFYDGYEKIVSAILITVYGVAKFRDLVIAGTFLSRSFKKFLQNSNFGVVPTKEQQGTAGGQCPICHEQFNSPIMLECNHIFCDLCIGIWFDRENTCPLCRAKVVDDPAFRDGSTTFIVQLF